MIEDPPSLTAAAEAMAVRKLPTSLTAAAEAMAVRKLPASPSAMPRQFDGQDGGQDGMMEKRIQPASSARDGLCRATGYSRRRPFDKLRASDFARAPPDRMAGQDGAAGGGRAEKKREWNHGV